MTKLVLIDGSSYLFRAYYALPPLTNTKGRPTGAIYGVINMLKKLMADYPTPYIAVVFDPKGKTFRDDLYPQYKAHRKQMPDDLREQIKPLFDVIKAMGLPLIIEEGFEADDVIATLAHLAKRAGMSVVISTGDKDLAQIVDDRVTLVNTMTNRVLDIPGVSEKFGVPPEKMIDYLTLVGDSTDNIPGVVGVGPKTAVKWLNTYGSLDNIIQQASVITGKVGENLRAHLADIPLMRALVTVKHDLLLNETPQDLLCSEPKRELLIQLFTDLEFKTWLRELQATEPSLSKPAKKQTTLINKKDFAAWLARLEKSDQFALDLETTESNAMHAKLISLSFALKDDMVRIPLDLIDLAEVLDKLKTIFADPQKILIGQNIKYIWEVLANHGVFIKNKLYDTVLEAYVLNSNQVRDEPQTVDVTWQTHQKLWGTIKTEKSLTDLFEQIEMPLLPILAKMEMVGVLINTDSLKQQSNVLKNRIDILIKQAHQLAGHAFNLSSPQQLQKVLYDELKIPVFKKTPGGAPSTSEHVLQELALLYELPKIILEHRQLSKLKSTYTDRLPEQINPVTGRIHTSYNQAVTSTGRLSSNNPNLQNIPIRTEAGRKIRQAFIAPDGFRIVAADYSQIELRIIAHISQDAGLLQAFSEGLDIHRSTASEIFAVPIEQVSLEQRRRAKAINFGLLYGMSAFGLSRQLGITRETAQNYINIYFQRYPNVHEYMQTIRTQAEQLGYVETLFGRRVYLPDINAGNLQRRRAAMRAAINAPMQGTAADIIKLAMIAVDRWLHTAAAKVQAHMIMQVHDELVFEVAENDVPLVVAGVQDCMQRAAQLSVPLVAEVGVGNNWDEAH